MLNNVCPVRTPYSHEPVLFLTKEGNTLKVAPLLERDSWYKIRICKHCGLVYAELNDAVVVVES